MTCPVMCVCVNRAIFVPPVEEGTGVDILMKYRMQYFSYIVERAMQEASFSRECLFVCQGGSVVLEIRQSEWRGVNKDISRPVTLSCHHFLWEAYNSCRTAGHRQRTVVSSTCYLPSGLRPNLRFSANAMGLAEYTITHVCIRWIVVLDKEDFIGQWPFHLLM